VSDISITLRPIGLEEAFGRSRGSPARVAAGWLCLAATPTFAIMALLTALGGGQPDILCATVHRASPFNGMVVMYLLMSAFHAASWLKLISSYRGMSSVLSGPAGAAGATGVGGGG
jgi:uncharacterized membrane protein